MDLLNNLVNFVAKLPELVALLVCPGLLLIGGLLFAVFRLRKGYLPLAIGLGGVGFFLVYCQDRAASIAFLALFIVWAALVSLLFCIPFKKKKRNVQEEMYEKFRVELDVPEELPKECGELLDREEYGPRLAHTMGLLEKLKKSDLSASDRLEADALSRTLQNFGDRDLTAEEMRSLNDCLATVLKLTAKYKL